MSNDPFQQALEKIEELNAKMKPFEEERARWQRWVNDGDVLAGREPRFKNVGDASMFTVDGVLKPKGRQFSPGQFYNKPFAGAVKLIMLGRFEANGNEPSPASVEEIYDALTQGSFNFETSGADNQKNSIRISLGKNSSTFVKLPGADQLFGLVEWYGGRKVTKPRKTSAAAAGFGSDADEDAATSADEAETETTATQNE